MKTRYMLSVATFSVALLSCGDDLEHPIPHEFENCFVRTLVEYTTKEIVGSGSYLEGSHDNHELFAYCLDFARGLTNAKAQCLESQNINPSLCNIFFDIDDCKRTVRLESRVSENSVELDCQ